MWLQWLHTGWCMLTCTCLGHEYGPRISAADELRKMFGDSAGVSALAPAYQECWRCKHRRYIK